MTPYLEEKVADEWGPEKILQVYDPDTDMKGVLVIDNTSTGPGKGGIRFADTDVILLMSLRVKLYSNNSSIDKLATCEFS